MRHYLLNTSRHAGSSPRPSRPRGGADGHQRDCTGLRAIVLADRRYYPAIGAWDAAHVPPIGVICLKLGGTAVVTHVPIPSDCQDGFLGAFWRRPHAYLDPDVQDGISTFLLIRDEMRRQGERMLGHELENGEWHRRFGDLLELDELDVGYRLVTVHLWEDASTRILRFQ